jgi:hypothetical protein
MLVSYLVSEAAPQLVEGKSYVFFMGPEATHSTVGWAQGLYRIENVAQNGQTMPVLISGDNQPLLMTSSGEMRRGAVVEVRDGKLKPISASVSSWHSELPNAPGVADVAPGSAPAAGAPPPPPVSQSAAPITRYATLDDLRRFVQGGATHRGQ